METVLVIVGILALVGGSAVVMARQGWLPASLPILRPSDGEPVAESPDETPALAEPEPLPLPSAKPAASSAPVTTAGPARESIRLDLVPAPADIVSARIDRIETRLDEVHGALSWQNERLADEARRLREELVRRAEAEEARREAAQERLRADVLALVSRAGIERQPGNNARRMEVSAELYARLARLEAALATVTNPVLLPGEPYAPPAELAPEALVWENWNEVGERAFALAECYSGQRLHLSAQTRGDIGEFVTTLRTLLTRSIYPNLQADVDDGRQATLRAALTEIANELPKIRDLLETEYLEGRTG